MSAGPVASEAVGKHRLRARAWLGIRIASSLGLLALLFTRINLADLLENFSSIRWGWLLVGLTLNQTQTAISALKWRVILASDRLRFGFLFLFKSYLIGNFLSLFLPTGFGGDVYRIWSVNKAGAATSKGAASVLFDRVSGLFALLGIAMIGCVLLIGTRHAIPLVVSFLAGIIAFIVLTSNAFICRLPGSSGRLLGLPCRILQSFSAYRRDPKTLSIALSLSAVFQFNSVLIITCYARALGILPTDVSFLEMVAVLPLILLSEVLPSINGIGVREGAFVFFFPLVGGTAEQALALSLLVITLRYLLGTVGGVLLLLNTLSREPAADALRVSAEPITPTAI